MIEFISLQLKLSFGRNKNNSKTTAILTTLFGLVVVVALLAVFYFLTQMLYNNVGVSAQKLSVVFVTVLLLALTVIGITLHLKRLYRADDINITARFPLSTLELYIANLIIIYINLMIYSALLFVPVMSVFAMATNTFTTKMALGIVLSTLFAPTVPFALSTIISLPVMFIFSLLENKNIIKLIIFIVVVALFFVLYNEILTLLAQFFAHRNIDANAVNVWSQIINGSNGWYNPAYWLSGIIFINNFWAGLGVTLAIFVVLSAIGVLAAKPVYTKVVTNALDGGGKRLVYNTKVDKLGPTAAIFRYNFKEIVRNKVFAYFYLGIAIATPVMVFFCDRLVMTLGELSLNTKISFGASMLVIACFMAMISAFAAFALSMEGKQFYITKMMPISYTSQLLIKASQNLMVSTGASLISCIVIASLKFVTPLQTLLLFVFNLLLSIGFVFNGINLNLANPNLNVKASGEMDELNVSIMMLIGMVLSAIIGAMAIVLPFFISNVYVYLIIAAIILVYTLINTLIFIFTANRKYSRIG